MLPKCHVGNRQDNHPSTQIPRKSISNSVKTPALLFYKPTINSSQKNKQSHQTLKQNSSSKNLSMFNQQETSQNNQFYCENHPNVPAKFCSKIQEDQEIIYYCQRCAHLLREQGFSISQVLTQSKKSGRNVKNTNKPVKRQRSIKSSKIICVNNYPYPERQQQIKSFIASLSNARSQIQQNNNQVRQILINSQEFYGEQIEQINEYFQNIIQSLQLQKNKCYNHILTERQNAQKETRNIMKKLSQGQKQISSMMLDIEENLDSVYSISWQNYKLVMDTFEARILEIHKVLNQVREKGIAEVQYRKIQFAGVPESINSLSQIIIQNSYGSVPEPDGSLLLTQNSNSSSFQQHPLEMFSNMQQNTIIQKLQTDPNQDQIQQNNLMFSFDGERMKFQQIYSDSRENNCQYNNNNADYIYEQSQMPIKLRINRSLTSSNQCVQKLQGIKQVEELDAIMDEQLLFIPPGLKFAR